MTTTTRLRTRQRIPGHIHQAVLDGLVGQRVTIVRASDNLLASVLIPEGECTVVAATLIRYGPEFDIHNPERFTEVMVTVDYTDDDPEPPTELGITVIDHAPPNTTVAPPVEDNRATSSLLNLRTCRGCLGSKHIGDGPCLRCGGTGVTG
jgi:hypothetical protein